MAEKIIIIERMVWPSQVGQRGWFIATTFFIFSF
jgi:hypothetical protein